MSTLDAKKLVSGKYGIVTAIIDGSVEEMVYVKSVEAIATKDKSEIKVIGRTMSQHRSHGINGTGTMVVFYISPKFRRLMKKYKDDGVDTYFNMIVTNDDPTANYYGAGKQVATLYDVNLDATVITKLDIDSSELDENCDFTFDDYDLIEEFRD